MGCCPFCACKGGGWKHRGRQVDQMTAFQAQRGALNWLRKRSTENVEPVRNFDFGSRGTCIRAAVSGSGHSDALPGSCRRAPGVSFAGLLPGLKLAPPLLQLLVSSCPSPSPPSLSLLVFLPFFYLSVPRSFLVVQTPNFELCLSLFQGPRTTFIKPLCDSN